MGKKIFYQLISVTIFTLYLTNIVSFLPNSVIALEAIQKQVIDGGSTRFDVDNCAGNKDSGSGVDNNLYMLGDSLTVAMKDQGNLEDALDANGFTMGKIQATSGYTVSDSLPKVDEDSDVLADVKVVVVALGTNPENDFGSKIPTLIDKLKEKAPDAKIYWMNIHVKDGVDTDPSFLGNSQINALIDHKASDLDYTVLNWESEVTSHPDKYPYLEDGVHHTAEANIARAQWLSDQLKGSSDTTTADSSSEPGGCQCSPGGGTGTLIGADNEEKIWNYLSSGKGINAIQTAGIMGNMFAESGYDPTSIEPSPGTGRGLVQWSFGRRPPMEAAASAAGVNLTLNDDANLIFQLDYMINESKGRTSRSFPEVNEWEGLTRTTNVDSQDHKVGSTLYWEWNFERSSGAHNEKRVTAALGVLAKFGGGAGGDTSTTSSGGCSETSEVCEGETSLPIPESTQITFFNSHNHHQSVSYPEGSAKHRPILSSSNAFGSDSISGSSSNKGEAADVGAAAGTTVFAPLTGKVLYSGHIHRGESDQMIIIESEDKKCVSAEAHIQASVEEGDSVTAGQEVGVLSSISTPHVHFELWVDGKPVNIGLDSDPCGLDDKDCDNFSDEAEQIWDKQKEALTGAAPGPVANTESEASSAD